jgi:acyl carrier protein
MVYYPAVKKLPILAKKRMTTLETVRNLLAETLQLGSRAEKLSPASPLLGSLAELDSIAVVSVITAIEENFAIVIADDEISADTFATLGSLASFVEHKLNANG